MVTIAAKHARAYRLADNRSGEFSTWDLDVLPGELAGVPTAQLEALPALDFNALVSPQPVEGQNGPTASTSPRTRRHRGGALGGVHRTHGDAMTERADRIDHCPARSYTSQ